MISAGKGLTPGMGMGICDGIQAIGGAVSAAWGAAIMGDIYAIQERRAKSAYEHEATMAKKETDDQLKTIKNSEEKLYIQQEAHKAGLAAKEELKKARDEEALVKEEIGEAKLTERTSMISDRALALLFNRRNEYIYGDPAVALS